MSHVVPIIIIALLVWQWFIKGRTRTKRPEADSMEPVSPRTELVEEVTELARAARKHNEGSAAIASLLDERGQELVGRAVNRVLGDPSETPAAMAGLVEQIEPVVSKGRNWKGTSQRPTRQRARYFLEGADNPRRGEDRIAKIERSIMGKGLCSPRQD